MRRIAANCGRTESITTLSQTKQKGVICLTLLFLRTLLMYAALIFGLRLTGKRQLGQLSTAEFAVTFLISEVAAIPLQDAAMPLVAGLVPLATLTAVEILLSVCSCKIRGVRRLLCGSPCIVIRDGKLDEAMLQQLRLSPDEILEELRTAGVFRIEDVRYAIVEPGGQLSVLQHGETLPATAGDLGLKPAKNGMPLIIVSDGTIVQKNLDALGKTRPWLEAQCSRHGIKRLGDVYLFTLDDCGNVFIQRKQTGNEGTS